MTRHSTMLRHLQNTSLLSKHTRTEALHRTSPPSPIPLLRIPHFVHHPLRTTLESTCRKDVARCIILGLESAQENVVLVDTASRATPVSCVVFCQSILGRNYYTAHPPPIPLPRIPQFVHHPLRTLWKAHAPKTLLVAFILA